MIAGKKSKAREEQTTARATPQNHSDGKKQTGEEGECRQASTTNPGCTRVSMTSFEPLKVLRAPFG